MTNEMYARQIKKSFQNEEFEEVFELKIGDKICWEELGIGSTYTVYATIETQEELDSVNETLEVDNELYIQKIR